MSLSKLIKSSGSALLAALLASTVLSAPAFAESERRGGNNSGQAQGQARGGGSWQGGGGRQWGGAERSQARPNMERGSRVQSGRDFRNNGAAPDSMRRGGWGDYARDNRSRATPPVAQAPSMRERETAVRRDRSTWRPERHQESNTRVERQRDRTPTYSDPNRNRSYTDRDRQAATETWRRDSDRSTRWSSDRDRDDRRSRNYNWSGNRDGWRDGDRRYSGHQRWSNDWRRDRRYDWYNYRNSYRHIYRPGPYYSPYRHHHYSRISIGFYLDSMFYGDRYWLSDPGYYRLPAAYGPYRWVRYYDDVLLIDIYSGEVVDVIYDFFW